MQNALSYTPDDGSDQDGAFWMPFSAFTVHFEDIYVCRLLKPVAEGGKWHAYTAEGQWKGKTAGGCTNTPDTAQWNPQYYVSVSKPANLFIVLDAEEIVGQDDACIGFKLLKKGGKRCKNVYAGESILQASYSYSRSVYVEGKVAADSTPLTLFVSTFEPRQERKFKATVYSDVPLDMTDGGKLRLIPESVPAV